MILSDHTMASPRGSVRAHPYPVELVLLTALLIISSDAARAQPTFPSLIGVEASRAEAVRLRDEAIAALDAFVPSAVAPLCALAEYIVSRSH